MEVAEPNPIKIEPEEEALLAEEPFSASSTVLESNVVTKQENDEEIDIMGTSDNEQDVQMSSSNGSQSNGTRTKRVSFVHPSSSTTGPRPTRVMIPAAAMNKRTIAKPVRTKYVKDVNKKEMTFNTAPDYNYMDDEVFFKREEIPLPFEDVRLYEEGLEMRPLGEQRYVVDAIVTSFNILQQEARRIQGQLRALNARSGRIRKQIDREEEAIARGEDPTEVPRSSKGLLDGDLILPAKIPVRPSARPSSSSRRRKRKIVRRKPQVARNRNTQPAGNIKLAGKPKEEAKDSDYE
jgi:hypothetical protein